MLEALDVGGKRPLHATGRVDVLFSLESEDCDDSCGCDPAPPEPVLPTEAEIEAELARKRKKQQRGSWKHNSSERMRAEQANVLKRLLQTLDSAERAEWVGP